MRLGLIIMAALHSLQAVALSEVRQIETNGIQYDVIITKPKNIRIIYKDDQGTPLKTFRNAFDYLKKQNLEVKALMNGGIFEPGEIPSGLLIQNQKELCPLNLKNGSGNFFMKPNGVFLIANDKAFVLPSKLYAKASCIPTYAVQSGPLLLDKEKIHPSISAQSNSRKVRNGVGILKNGRVLLAITSDQTTQLPNMHDFADFFRHQGCTDALYLDGTISQLATGSQSMAVERKIASFVGVVVSK
jgi:uncharacterized protein YigE (DUF2233 family)